MLTNKKTSIRLLALVMALLMTVAVFVGCTDNSAAEAEIQAAKDAAAAAQAAADAAKAQAESIKAQLEAAQKAAEEAQKAAQEAQKDVDSYHDGKETEKAPDAIEKDPYDAATNYVTESILAEFSALKVQYLNIQQTWYTDDNYIKLAKIFDDASVALYRATTKEGVENVLTKLSADAAAIANIYTDAEAVQALIVALGNVDTDVTLNSADKVTAAENAYLNWVEDYAKYFATQGINVAYYEKNAAVADQVDDIAEDAFAIAVPTIAYAQNKILLLTHLAEEVSDVVFWAVMVNQNGPYNTDSAWFADRYEELAGVGAIEGIVSAYELYKTFVVLNGGDETPIKDSEYINGARYSLTGEEFVKEYVNIIFTAWLQQYQTAVKTLINGLPAFFMESYAAGTVELPLYLTADLTGLDLAYLGTYQYATFGANTELGDFAGSEYDGQTASVADGNWYTKLNIYDAEGNSEKFRNELEYVATKYNAEILKLDYMKDFKGKLSLEDAFRQIDASAEKAIVEMAQSYYTQVIVAYETNELNAKVAALVGVYNAALAAADADLAAALKSYVDTFSTEIVKIADDAKAYMDTVKIPTYDELNSRWNSNKALYNIDNLDLFTINDYVADGFVYITLNVTDNGLSPVHLILKGIKDTNAAMYKKLGNDFYNKLAKEVQFFTFKMNLAAELLTVVDNFTNTAALNTANAIFTGAGAKTIKNTDAAWKDYVAAQDALLADAVKSIMDLDYDSFKSVTNAAVSETGKTLYHNSGKVTTDKKTALNVVTDKLVVAKDAAVAAFATASDKYFTNYIDLFRAAINADFDQAIEAYNKNYADDKDSVNLMTDINAYVEYLKSLTTATSVPTFKTSAFRLGNKLTYVKNKTVASYASELGYVNASNTLHVVNYAGADVVSADYNTKANAAIAALLDLVAGTETAYRKLEKVRLLAYYKDDAMVAVDETLKDYKGEWDAEKNAWTDAPALMYDIKAARTAKYLAELDATAARVKEAIKNISLLSENANGDKYTYANAVAVVDAYLAATTTATSTADPDAKWIHDFSFVTTYDRYYRTNDDGSTFYDWDWYYNAD